MNSVPLAEFVPLAQNFRAVSRTPYRKPSTLIHSVPQLFRTFRRALYRSPKYFRTVTVPYRQPNSVPLADRIPYRNRSVRPTSVPLAEFVPLAQPFRTVSRAPHREPNPLRTATILHRSPNSVPFAKIIPYGNRSVPIAKPHSVSRIPLVPQLFHTVCRPPSSVSRIHFVP